MRALAFLLVLCCVQPAYADLFTAAGRIESRESGGGCSAALIGPDVIVTAAHCVGEGDDRDYVFRLGAATRTELVPVDRIVVHPLYSDFHRQRLRRLRFDIAVGRLSAPIDPVTVKAFQLGDEARIGEGLFLASWRLGNTPRPRERRCLVIEGEVPGVVTLGCRVRGGESGAPVLRMTEDGVELVAIVNSTAQQGSRSVAFAADVRLRIPPLLDRLQDGS